MSTGNDTVSGHGSSYHDAFSRHRGLINPSEQGELRGKHVAIAGLGGIGGIELLTLARLGIGKFTIADPDVFETSNLNRQAGATVSTLGRPKAEVMAEMVRDINPEAEVHDLVGPVTIEGAAEFVKDADLFIDAIDAFEIEIRRSLHREAARADIHSLVAGPVGFGATWIIFSPEGMSFDEYFDLSDSDDRIDHLAAFAVGMTPKGLHLPYMDLDNADINARSGPSSGAACNLTAGVVGVETVKLLLGRGNVPTAPHYHQFDVYVGRLNHGSLVFGNRGLIQRIKRLCLTNYLRRRFEQKQGLQKNGIGALLVDRLVLAQLSRRGSPSMAAGEPPRRLLRSSDGK